MAWGGGRRLSDWEPEHLGQFEGFSNITIAALDNAFLAELVGLLDRSIVWALTVSGGVLYLDSGSTHLESALRHLAGPPLLPV